MIRKFFRYVTTGLMAACLALIFAGQSQGQIDGLVMKLRADSYDDSTGIWADTSGQGRDMKQTNSADLVRPTKVSGQTPNGNSVVRFDQADFMKLDVEDFILPANIYLDSEQTQLNPESGVTYIAYVRPDAYTEPGDGRWLVSGQGGSPTWIFTRTGTQYGFQSGGGRLGYSFTENNDFGCYSFSLDRTGGEMRLNGVFDGDVASVDTILNGAPGPAWNYITHLSYGGGINNASFRGDIAEIRIYNRKLTQAEIETVEAELCAAYEEIPNEGITGVLQEVCENGEVKGLRLTVSGSLDTSHLAVNTVDETAAWKTRLLSNPDDSATFNQVNYLSCMPWSYTNQNTTTSLKNLPPGSMTQTGNLNIDLTSAGSTKLSGDYFLFNSHQNDVNNVNYVRFNKDYVSGSPVNCVCEWLSGPVGYLGRQVTYSFAEFGIEVGDHTTTTWTLNGVEGSIKLVAGEPINICNTAPTADAGANQSVRAGDTVHLDGSGSFDDNTEISNLLFSWSFASKPSGSNATLSDSSSRNPSFVSDAVGTYTLNLVVTEPAADGGLSSAAAQVEVSTENLAPTAAADVSHTLATVNDPVLLVGTGTDPEGDAITYHWELVSKPGDSTAFIVDTSAAITSLTPDLEGTYVFQLVVSDELGPGTSVQIEFTATTCEGFAETLIIDASDIVAGLSNGQVTTQGNRNAFLMQLANAMTMIQAGETIDAIKKLNKSISRTNGWLTGSPDGNGKGRDWITDLAAQEQIYNLLTLAVETLENCN